MYEDDEVSIEQQIDNLQTQLNVLDTEIHSLEQMISSGKNVADLQAAQNLCAEKQEERKVLAEYIRRKENTRRQLLK